MPPLQLDSLQVALFHSNAIAGIGNIQAPKLERLSISGNPIIQLPVFTLASLKELWAGGCQITGSLNQWNTPALEVLNLSFNKLSVLSAGLNYPKLKYVDLSSNVISGQLPFWNTPKLEYLHLGDNQLTSVSGELNYAHLYFFNIGNNQIAGNVPDWSFPAIKELVAYNNQFSGSLPDFDFPEIAIF